MTTLTDTDSSRHGSARRSFAPSAPTPKSTRIPQAWQIAITAAHDALLAAGKDPYEMQTIPVPASLNLTA